MTKASGVAKLDRRTRIALARAALAAKQAAQVEKVYRYEARQAHLTAVARRARGEGGEWCILRTAGPSTIRLAETLNMAEIEAWTPIAHQTRRMRASRAEVERAVPLVPTIVFARAEHRGQLLMLAATTTKAQPPFSVFRYLGEVPTVADGSLRPLRAEEQRFANMRERERRNALAKRKAAPFTVGETVTMPGMIWAGMPATVEASDDRHTLVTVGGRIPLNIPTSLLRNVEVQAHAA